METEEPNVTIDRMTPDQMQRTKGGIKKMLLVGALFAIVGYLLILAALFLELTQFHPLLEQYFTIYTEHSLAGGGPDRAGAAGINQQLTSIHQFPSTLLWLKLGGIGHILLGIFISLAAIVRALSMMPHRLSYELSRINE